MPQNSIPSTQTANSAPPKNTLPATKVQRAASHPDNKRRFTAYLTSAQEQATEDLVNEVDELTEITKELILDDSSLKDKINGNRDIRKALEDFEDTGHTAALEKLLNDPNTPDSVKDKISVLLDLNELQEDLEDGLTPAGLDRKIRRFRDRISDSDHLTASEKRELREALDNLKVINERRKLIELLTKGGLGSKGKGGLPTIDLSVVVTDGSLFGDSPVNDSNATTTSAGVLLRNPESNGASISYLLDGHSYTMEPGYSQRLERSYLIEFDRGGDYGTARYTIADGTFEFTITDRGWDLRKKTYEITIDNRNFPGDFGYLLDGQEYTVRAGEVRQHSSSYPILIEFDRGDGSEPARKVLYSGTYTVGIDVTHGRLDLFEGGASKPAPALTAN